MREEKSSSFPVLMIFSIKKREKLKIEKISETKNWFFKKKSTKLINL